MNVRWIEGLLVSTLSLGMISVCLVSLGGCPSTQARCIDPRTDVDHCGRCGERCRSSMDTCIAGICTRDDDD